MDFEPNSEQRQLQDVAQRIVDTKINPLLSSLPAAPLSRENLLEIFGWLEPLGFLGARIPEDLGGSGFDYVTYGLLMETLPPVVALAVLGQESLATRIALSGTPEHHARFLRPLLKAERIGGSATSEPGVGSDPRGITSLARRSGNDYLLSGQKLWTTNGSVADLMMVVTLMEEEPGGERTSGRLIVDTSESKCDAREVATIGLCQGHLGEVFFDDCRVSDRNVLGEAGDFHRFLTRTWLSNRPIFGLMAAHLSRLALDACVSYAKERKQFGKAIGSFQLIQEMIGEVATIVDVSRLLSFRALAALDRGGWPHRESSMAKLYGTTGAIRATNLAIEVHGSIGLTRELPLEQYLRDARMLTMPDGTTQIQQLIIGRELLGIRAF